MPRFVAFAVLIAVVLAALGATASQQYRGDNVHPQFADVLTQGGMHPVTRTGNRFKGYILGDSLHSNGTIPAGQELRLRVVTAYLANVTDPMRLPSGGIVRPFDGLHSPYGLHLSSLLKLGNYSLLPAWNISGPSPVRTRVIAAYSSRDVRNDYGADTAVACAHGASHDVWSEAWAMSPRNLAFGRHMVFAAFTTFTAPPFHWRVCIKDTTVRNSTRDGQIRDDSLNYGWMEFEKWGGKAWRWNKPLFMWRTAAAANEAGEYGAVEIVPMWDKRRLLRTHTFQPGHFSLLDNIKLVPYGYPCTYEKPGSRPDQSITTDTTRTDQYCGSNVIHPFTGEWLQTSTCPMEGSVAGGVARIGSKAQNPLATNTPPSDYVTSPFAPLATLVGYLQFPAAGDYEVCVSTRAYRRAAFNNSVSSFRDRANMDPNIDIDAYMQENTTYPRDASPLWFKAYAASSSDCADMVPGYGWSAACSPDKTVFTIDNASSTAPTTWSTTDETPTTWGEIKFESASGTLDYSAATAWDHSSPREYFDLQGGDMFRLVPTHRFASAAAATAGDLQRDVTITTASTVQGKTTSTVAATSVTHSSLSTLKAYGEGRFQQYALGTPSVGTALVEGGCWWAGDDNYGTNPAGAPTSSGCCGTPPCETNGWCANTENGMKGATASSDLGSDPRVDYSPWLMDGSGTTAYGFIRMPPGGEFHVCYRRAGGNWRMIPGVQSFRTTSNNTFTVRAKNGGFTYHFNDSRAETWGPVAVHSNDGATLDKVRWDYYTSTASTVQGSALKIVTSTENCLMVTAQPRTYSIDAGSAENMGLGSADDDATLTQKIHFYVHVPAFSTTTRYRICFRRGDENWHALSDPNFFAHDYMTVGNEFGPLMAPSLYFTLPAPAEEGMWGKFIFNRSADAAPSLNADGDMVHLVPNVTDGGLLVGCDVIYSNDTLSTAAAAHQWSATRLTSRIGRYCDAQTSTTTDECYSGTVQPTADGINANHPYTNINMDSDLTGLPSSDATVTFMTIPPTVLQSQVVSYRVCYKQARFANWHEAHWEGHGSLLTVTTGRTVTYSVPATRFSGQYTYIELDADAAHPITWSLDYVKLVDFANTCDGPTATSAGYTTYAAFSGVQSPYVLVDGTNSSTALTSAGESGTSTVARAYLTIPLLEDREGITKSYRVCYMARSGHASLDHNWHDLSGSSSPLVVEHAAVGYTVTVAPRVYGTIGVRFISGGRSLDTRPGRDAAKLVPSTGLCVEHGSTEFPDVALTAIDHQGNEPDSTPEGVADLPGSDSFPSRTAQMDVVVNSSNYKVCYKVFGTEWMEIMQVPAAERIYSLAATDSVLTTTSTEVDYFYVNPIIAAQPGATDTYYGLAWETAVVGGVSTYQDGSNYFTMYYNSARTGTEDIMKLVLTHREERPGTFTRIPGRSCLSAGRNFSFTTASGSTAGNIRFNMPTQAGRYLVCVFVTNVGTWFQMPADPLRNFEQPLTVLNPMHYFEATGSNTLRFVDLYDAGNATNLGGLSATDRVYIINASGGTGVCGGDNNFVGNTSGSSFSVLENSLHGVDTDNFLAVRDATIELPTRTEAFMVCLKRTQSQYSNASGASPFHPTGWYQVPNGGTTFGGGTDYYALAGATQLNISGCPVYNSTYRLRTGSTFDITLTATDANNEVVPYALGTKRYGVTMTTSGFDLQNFGGGCSSTVAESYGYTSGALSQFMEDGRLRVSLTSLSACPGGTCTVGFTSTNGLAAAPSCSFDVLPTTLKTVRIASLSSECGMERWCPIRIIAIHSDDGVAYTINSAVSVLTSGNTGLSVVARVASTQAEFGVGTGGSANFVNGVLDAEIKFSASSYADIAGATSVTVTASANGRTSIAWTTSVAKPIAAEVHVTDVYPIDTTGAPILPLHPTWEPEYSTTGLDAFRGGDVMGTSAVTAAPGYHLVAGQTYAVVLRVAAQVQGGTPEYYDNPQLVDSSVSVSLSSDAPLVSTSCTRDSCTTPVPSTSLAPTMVFEFRVQPFTSTSTCASGACGLNFLFNGATTIRPGAPETKVTTPVRHRATHLTYKCSSTIAGLASAVEGVACPESSVNKGWYINVTARDNHDNVDRFFDGDILAVFSSSATPSPNARLTTVSNLQNGVSTPGYVTTRAVGGRALISGLSFTRPCFGTGCVVQLLSTWGVGILDLGALQARPNTQRLACSLDTVLAYCATDASGNCGSIAGVSANNVTNAESLLYQDTTMCVNVNAVDIDGNPTLYETNWVLYYAEDTATSGKQALTIRDENANTDFVSRYKAMAQSGVRFCFTVSGTFSAAVSFRVNFVAQRFDSANYWSQGTTGACSVGPMKVWPKKKVAAFGLASAVGLEVVSPGANSVVATEKTGTSSMTVGLEFALYDHYGVTIPTADLAVDDQQFKVLLSTNNGDVDVVQSSLVSLRGIFNATAVATSASLASTVSFTLTLSDYCLGCKLLFTLVDSSDTAIGMISLASPSFALTVTADTTFHIVNTRSAAVRALSFHPGTSPLSGAWVNGTAGTSSSNVSTLTYHLSTCGATTCKPAPDAFNLAKCDSRGTTFVGASNTAPLQMRVLTLDPGYSLSSAYEPTTSSRSQVDILNTYTVAVSFGNQQFECLSLYGGMPCTDDGTSSPKQTVAAYGSTVRAAVTAFHGVADSNVSATAFFMAGLNVSSYLAVNETTGVFDADALPSVGGAFNASVTSSSFSGAVQAISMAPGNEFYWRPMAEPYAISILDIAVDADPCAPAMNSSYPCFGGLGCSTVGVLESGNITDGLAFNYSAQSIPVDVAFPMTIEVSDVAGARVTGAAGSISVAVESWTGCNNGGEASFTGSVVNGRATVWLTFTTPCENCVLKAVYTPSADQADSHAWMVATPASSRAMSRSVSITSTSPSADHVVASSSTPASILVPGSITEGTVATEFSASFAPRARTGFISFASTENIRQLSLRIETARDAGPGGLANWWIIGNGGVLRPSLSGNQYSHHRVSVTNANSLAFYFTRTCAGCRVVATYQLSDAAHVSFTLPTKFVITTTLSQRLLVGTQPSSVEIFSDVSFSMWATGSEADDIAHAGTALIPGSVAAPTFSVTTAGNGDGGSMSSTSWSTDVTQMHRVTFTLPCTRCTVQSAGVSVPIKIYTQPTFLQPIVPPSAGIAEPITTTSIGVEQTVELRALDDSGYVAETFSATVTPTLSFDGAQAGGFPRTESTFLMADPAAINGNPRLTGGSATMRFNFSEPIRNAYVIFTAGSVSSATTMIRPRFPQPRYAISVGTSSLVLRAVSNTDVTRLTSDLPFAFDVALTGFIGGDSSRSYVATVADNNITVSFTNCPAVDETTTPTQFFLNSGYKRINITFLAGDTTGTCSITFTANAGSGRCSGTGCSITLSGVAIRQLTPTSWRYLRPSSLDNGGRPAGVVYGAAGRQTRVTVQLFGTDAFGNNVPVRSCSTCRLEVRMDGTATGQFASCALNTEPPASFNSNGTSTVAVLYQDNAQPTYLCQLKVAVFSDVARTVPLLAPDLTSQFETSVVTICRPAKVAILTNTSSIYRGVLLKTGVAYDLLAVVQDANGDTCFGDSQDEATRLTVEAVTNDANLLLSRDIQILNVNRSDATSAGFANNWVSDQPARTEVRAINGGFNFRVVFSNSTVALGLDGIIIRVTARSATPSISGTSARAYSSPLDTIVAATRLRFAQAASLPNAVVSGRRIHTGRGGQYSTDVTVQAVDGLDPAWVSLGLLSTAPNVARAASSFGNAEEVLWKVLPTPGGGAFPISFGRGTQLARLSAGEYTWSNLTWNGPNGIFSWSVATTSGSLQETTPVQVACQDVASLRMETPGFAPGAPSTCTSGCLLPPSSFPLRQNETINSGIPTYAAESLQPFNLSVSFRDSNGAVVAGDSESVVMVELLSDSRTSVRLARPPSLTDTAPLYVRLRNGRAEFELAFAGSTSLGGNADANATIRFTCPETRPALTLLAGEDATNPCFGAGVLEATSVGFAVLDVRLPTSSHNTAGAIAARQVIKFATALRAHELFDQAAFRSRLVPLLDAAGFGYITTANAARVMTLLPCTTLASFNADLGNSVCEGSPRRCSAAAENLNCPASVLSCACPTVARSLLLRRFLLQSTPTVGSGNITYGDKTVVEMSFNLALADAFPARNTSELIAAYEALAAASMTALQDATMAEFVIDTNSISTRALNAAVQTAAPVVTPPPPTTAAPTNAPTTTEAPVASPAAGHNLSLGALLLLAALALFAWV